MMGTVVRPRSHNANVYYILYEVYSTLHSTFQMYMKHSQGLQCGVNVVLKPGLVFECLIIKKYKTDEKKIGFALKYEISKLRILFTAGKRLW